MKNLNLNNIEESLNSYALTVEEMISVKGGDMGEPIILPSVPPIKIWGSFEETEYFLVLI